MTVQYQVKTNAQWDLPLVKKWQVKSSAEWSLASAGMQWQVQTSGQWALPAYIQYQIKTSGQWTLPIWVQHQVQTSGQWSLPGWIQHQVKTSSQWQLDAYKQWQVETSAQWALSIYKTWQVKTTAQWDLAAYIQYQVATSAQWQLPALVQSQVMTSAQWILDAYSKVYSWAVNLDTKAVSEFDGMTLLHLAGRLGADSTGIYELGGTTDNGTEIEAFVESGALELKDAFGNAVQNTKHVSDVYLGLKGGKVDVTVTADGKTGTYRTQKTTILKPVRIEPGQGMLGRYWSVKIKNYRGSTAEIESVNMLFEKSTRRI